MIHPSQKIIDFIKDYEKLALKAYMPTPNDKPTIGYGMTFYPDGKPVKMGDTITKEKAEDMFFDHLQKFGLKVNNLIKTVLKQHQFDAILALAYNIGIGAFGTSTLLKLVNKNPLDLGIQKQFLAWVKQKGTTLPGLVKRRTQEADIYLKGIYNSKH